jgi:hypothetical protein
MAVILCSKVQHNFFKSLKNCRWNSLVRRYAVVVFEVIVKLSKPLKCMKYPCHICGIVGHRMVECPRFGEM